MPPKELPGFFWDATRNRYFPDSSRPKPVKLDKHIPRHNEAGVSETCEEIVVGQTSRVFGLLPYSTQSWARLNSEAHRWRCRLIQSGSREARTTVPIHGVITSFATAEINGTRQGVIGDDQGWIYTTLAMDDEDCRLTDEARSLRWSTELSFGISSEISTICISGTRCAITAFDSSCKIYISDLSLRSTPAFILNFKHNLRDVCSAHLLDKRLILGGSHKAMLIEDIESSTPSRRSLETHSDVLAVFQEQNVVYTGCRNGVITRFDHRLSTDTRGDKIPNGLARRANASVTYLKVIHGWKMLASYVNGEISAFDLRFVRENHPPLIEFKGHVNSFTTKLGIAVDSNEEFLFAASQDRRVQVWSIKTGQILDPNIPRDARTSDNLAPLIDNEGGIFRTRFSKCVPALQITESRRKGIVLWAAVARELYELEFGRMDDQHC